jgi:hypothetical protein
VLALEHEGPAIYNIVDDEPAPVREWLAGARPRPSVPSRRGASRSGSRGSCR